MKRCTCCKGSGIVAGDNEYEIQNCPECRGAGEIETAIVVVPHNPLPGMVDMNVLRFQLDLVKNAIKLVLYEVDSVVLEPDGSLKLREYDRITSLLRHFGVLNARIDWNPETRTIGIS